MVLYYAILYYTLLCYTILYYTILYYAILYYTILYYTILYYTILYYTIPYYIILYCILSLQLPVGPMDEKCRPGIADFRADLPRRRRGKLPGQDFDSSSVDDIGI